MGVRKGQGYGVPKPKRVHCPECGRKGVTQWKVTSHGQMRDCQYCQASWGEAGWALTRGVGRADTSKEPTLRPFDPDAPIYDVMTGRRIPFTEPRNDT